MNYFPIIRGKLYDLAAITALANSQRLPATVIPVLEPVKDIPGLTKTTQALTKTAHAAYVIQNPQVGSYRLLATPRHLPMLSPSVQVARIFDAQPAPLIIATTAAQAKLLARRQLALVPDEARVRRLALRRAVYLNDHFTVYSHTSAYGLLQDEFYQYPPKMLPGVGFADYPLATSDYFEHGFPQRQTSPFTSATTTCRFSPVASPCGSVIMSAILTKCSIPALRHLPSLAPICKWNMTSSALTPTPKPLKSRT